MQTHADSFRRVLKLRAKFQKIKVHFPKVPTVLLFGDTTKKYIDYFVGYYSLK